jgi:hypothetical protein
MATLRQLYGLCDRGVRGNAFHVHQLRRAKAEEVEQIGVEADDTAADTLIEIGVNAGAAAQHPIDQLAQPAAIARVEAGGATIEGGVEQLTTAKVPADLGGGDARVGHPADVRNGDAVTPAGPARSTGRPMVPLCPWHMS